MVFGSRFPIFAATLGRGKFGMMLNDQQLAMHGEESLVATKVL